MDVATRLARWKEHPPEQWLKSANRVLPPVVTGVLVLVIAYQLAGLTWRLVPGPAADAPPPEVSIQSTGSATAAPGAQSYERIAQAHLFGAAPAAGAAPEPVVQDVVDAPDTTLNLELTGIVSHEVSEVGQAIIASGRGESRAYSVGATIENASGARLHSVFEDRVLLNRSGRLETLRLPKDAPQRAAASAGRLAPPMARNDDESSLREVISDNASRITDIIRLAPHVEEGQMVGFRLNPGRDRDTFEALGLQAGDVVTDINGTVLNDPTAGLQVFQALGEATMANVTVLRDGVAQVIVIDTTQLENLAENRE
jgi:general secretion pathway protein C